MLDQRIISPLTNHRLIPILALFVLTIAVSMRPARALAQALPAPLEGSPYSVTTFATAPNGLTGPDSITFSPTSVFVGYGNGGAPDGTGGATSNIVEYDFTGKMLDNISIPGHQDGLRYNPLDNSLWSVQNEDGNATLIVINLKNKKQTSYTLGTGPHGGGYDDIDFIGKAVYVSASAPTISPDNEPAIVSVTIRGNTAKLAGVINGNAQVTDVTTGKTVTLNLTDPDSMIVDPFGELVMTSQGDGELIIVQHPGLPCQKGLVVPLSSQDGGTTPGNTQLDDTVFSTQSAGKLLVADKGLETVYAITTPYFGPAAYSAVSVFANPTDANPIESFVGQTNLTTGFVSPIVTGMSNPGGMAFIPSGVDLAKFIKASVEVPEVCPQ